MMNSGNYAIVTAAVTIGLVFHAIMYAPQPAIMAELAPIIAVKLLEVYDSSVPIAVYLAAACAITLIAVVFTRETKGIDLTSLDLVDAEELAQQRQAAVG